MIQHVYEMGRKELKKINNEMLSELFQDAYYMD